MKTKLTKVAALKPHPQNYRTHPAKQLRHLADSIKAHGVIRPVVVAEDGATILAGHGLVEAARLGGVESVPVLVMPYAADSPQARHLIVADNEPFNLGHADPQGLLDLLAVLKESDMLGGTGLDEWPPEWQVAGAQPPAPATTPPPQKTAGNMTAEPGVNTPVVHCVCASEDAAEAVRRAVHDIPGVVVTTRWKKASAAGDEL